MVGSKSILELELADSNTHVGYIVQVKTQTQSGFLSDGGVLSFQKSPCSLQKDMLFSTAIFKMWIQGREFTCIVGEFVLKPQNSVASSEACPSAGLTFLPPSVIRTH